MKSRSTLAALLVTSVLVPAACSSKKPPPPVPPTPVADAGDEAGLDGGDLDAGPEAGLGAVEAPDAGAPVGTPPVADATDATIDLAVQALAKTVAPGMEMEGQPGRATLAPNEHFNMLVTMQPGRCYTILGMSPAGQVTQLDLRLFAPPLYNIEAGRATNQKSQPIIGKGKAALCPALPLAIPYKVDAAAVKGAGRIGVFVFSKAK